jgi:hypothetical protein
MQVDEIVHYNRLGSLSYVTKAEVYMYTHICKDFSIVYSSNFSGETLLMNRVWILSSLYLTCYESTNISLSHARHARHSNHPIGYLYFSEAE